jgi:hypothetical protein
MFKTATASVLILLGFMAAVGLASQTNSAASAALRPAFGVKLCHGSADYASAVESLAQMLVDSSGGRFGIADTYTISVPEATRRSRLPIGTTSATTPSW